MLLLVKQNSSNKPCIGTAALINFFVPNAALIRGGRLFRGGGYSNKYGILASGLYEISHESLVFSQYNKKYK